MLRWPSRIVALLAVIWLNLDLAIAGTRVALVIGNGAYEHAGGLPNPTRDASDIAAALRSIGFDVSELQNARKRDFEAALSDFSEKSAGADFAVIYFAGHGIEVDHQNYLIPTDAALATDRRLRFEAVSLDDVMATLDGVSGIRMVLLDACRNNPFAASMRVTSASRSIGRGFAPVEAGVRGTVISYSARAGTVASDGSGRNSPFAAALLENITKPGLEIQFMLREVRDSVLTATNGTQEPFISASLGREAVYLVPPDDKQPDTGNLPPLSAEPIAADYQAAERIGTAEAWDAFLATHGGETGNFYVALANAARRKFAPNVPPTPAVEPAPAAVEPTTAMTDAEQPEPDGELGMEAKKPPKDNLALGVNKPKPEQQTTDFTGDGKFFVDRVFASTERVWTDKFQQMGRQYEKPGLVLFSDSVRSPCSMTQSATGPFYCPNDNKVYIDLSFYQDMKNKLGVPGDFAQAYVIAHEVGHHIQNILGIAAKVRQARTQAPQEEGNLLSVRMELQADCLAGVWAKSANFTNQILEESDIAERLNAATSIGDGRRLQRSQGHSSQGYVAETFTHGSSPKRARWFMKGMQTGDMNSCDTFGTDQL